MGAGCCGTKNRIKAETPEYEWATLLKTAKLESLIQNNSSKIKDLLFRGIPNSLRWEVWTKLISQDLSTEYQSLVQNTTMDSQIDKDLHRTFPHNEYLSSPNGQGSLGKLLNTLARKFSNQGYWQGMNYITATCLILSIGNESETFSFVSSLYQTFGVISLYEEKFEKVRTYCRKFHETLEKVDKDYEKHIKTIGLDDSLWIFKWFITLFTYSYEYKDVLRIWDGLLAKDLNFMVNIAVSAALNLKEKIQEMTIEQALGCLEKCQVDIEKVLSDAKNISIDWHNAV
jgi:hypothetical protein